jgi:hypothetical protein
MGSPNWLNKAGRWAVTHNINGQSVEATPEAAAVLLRCFAVGRTVSQAVGTDACRPKPVLRQLTRASRLWSFPKRGIGHVSLPIPALPMFDRRGAKWSIALSNDARSADRSCGSKH